MVIAGAMLRGCRYYGLGFVETRYVGELEYARPNNRWLRIATCPVVESLQLYRGKLSLGDGSHGGELVLGALLGAAATLRLLLLESCLATTFLLGHDAAKGLALHSHAFAFHLEELDLGDLGRAGVRRREAAVAGDAVGVVLEILGEKVLVGKVRGGSGLAVKVGEGISAWP